jgi:hypothetical protein
MAIEITNQQPTTFDAMLESWAAAEADSRLGPLLPPEALRRLVGRTPTPEDLKLSRYAVMYVRGPMLAPFLPLPAEWFDADINVDGLAEVSTPLFWRQQGFATLGELTDGRPDVTVDGGFDLDRVRGRPVLVSVDGDAPWYLIEGGHRCCEIIRLRRAGKFGDALPVIVGVCPRARENPHIG